MFVVVQHPRATFFRRSGPETVVWASRASSLPLKTVAEARVRMAEDKTRAAERGSEDSFSVAEIVEDRSKEDGSATVRDVIRVLGGPGRGPTYAIEMY